MAGLLPQGQKIMIFAEGVLIINPIYEDPAKSRYFKLIKKMATLTVMDRCSSARTLPLALSGIFMGCVFPVSGEIEVAGVRWLLLGTFIQIFQILP